MSLELSKFLKFLRGKKSLREISLATGISNAYLSQLETGVAKLPSPAILLKLADLYNCPYDELMRLAGYMKTNQQQAQPINYIQQAEVALMSDGLSPEQVEEVMKYVRYIREKTTQG